MVVMGGKEIIQNISTQSHLMEQHLWTSTLLFFYFNWDRINFSHPQESRAWEDKCQHSKYSPLPSSIPALQAEHGATWDGISFTSQILARPQSPLWKGVRGLDTATTAQ